MDEDELPPRCEETVSEFNRRSGQLSSALCCYESTIGFIGLEYVVEVNPDSDIDDILQPFFVCLICEERCNILDSIIIHLKSSIHRFLYLSKYFPRAHSLFLPVPKCLEQWPISVHYYLEDIVWLIITAKGRLPVTVMSRSQWDWKASQLKSVIDSGIHLRETADLSYDSIPSPFETTKNNENMEVQDVMYIDSTCMQLGIKESQRSSSSLSADFTTNNKADKEKSENITTEAITAPRVNLNDADDEVLVEKQVIRSRTCEIIVSSKDWTVSQSSSQSGSLRNKPDDSKLVKAQLKAKRPPTSNRHNPYRCGRPAVQGQEPGETDDSKLKKLEIELARMEEKLLRKRKFYEKRPEDHPQYTTEWKMFLHNRYSDPNANDTGELESDFKPEWTRFWQNRLKDLYQEEIKTKQVEIKSKYGLMENLPQDSSEEEISGRKSMEGTDSHQSSWEKVEEMTGLNLRRETLIGVPNKNGIGKIILNPAKCTAGKQPELNNRASRDCLEHTACSSDLHSKIQLEKTNCSNCQPVADKTKYTDYDLQAAGLLHGTQPTQSAPTGKHTLDCTAAVPVPSYSNRRNNEPASSGPNDGDLPCRFTAEELKTLITNFRFLKSTQKRDLISLLCHLEEKYDCDAKISRASLSVYSTEPLSPLSIKYQKYDSQSAINPFAPDSSSLPNRRHPAILKTTGLSTGDLEKCGVPVDAITAYASSKSTPILIGETPNETIVNATLVKQSRLPAMKTNVVARPTHLPCQPLYSPDPRVQAILSHNQSFQHFQPTSQSHFLTVPQLDCYQMSGQQRRPSFCHQSLDPRQNTVLFLRRHDGSILRNLCPILIPTSPLLQDGTNGPTSTSFPF